MILAVFYGLLFGGLLALVSSSPGGVVCVLVVAAHFSFTYPMPWSDKHHDSE